MDKKREPVLIDKPEKLKEYLTEEGNKHKRYYHFTNSESVNAIINNRTLRLTLGDSKKLNDRHEFMVNGKPEVWERTYFACFSYGISENMAMWGLYGLPSKEAVRLTFNKEIVNIIMDMDKIKIYSDKEMENELDKNSIKEIFLTDVLYVKDKYKVDETPKHKDDTLEFADKELNNILGSEEATGIVKNYVWSHETEVRLIIRFKKNDENVTRSEFIYLKFPEEVLEKIEIMKGPAFEEEYINKKYDLNNMKEKSITEEKNNENLINNINSINEKINKKNEANKEHKNKCKKIKNIQFNDSKFKGLIHFKSDNFVQVLNKGK